MEEWRPTAAYDLIRDRTTWPAVMLAASRKDRVRGRTRILDVSMRIRNGLSQSGAPSGRRWAIDWRGLNMKEEMIILSQAGSPIDRVMKRCLVGLKQ